MAPGLGRGEQLMANAYDILDRVTCKEISYRAGARDLLWVTSHLAMCDSEADIHHSLAELRVNRPEQFGPKRQYGLRDYD
jgi:hypothetical protein